MRFNPSTSFLLVVFFTLPSISFGQNISAFGLPAVTSVEGLEGDTTYSLSLQILLLMTALTVLPSLVLGMTSFTRIIIVLSILRQAMGTQQTPPKQNTGDEDKSKKFNPLRWLSDYLRQYVDKPGKYKDLFNQRMAALNESETPKV